MITRGFNLFVLLALCLSKVNAQKELQHYQVRHQTGNAPAEKNVDAKKTYDHNFMKKMHSACRPEEDGYFGSTYGNSRKLHFGFRVETKPLSSIMEVLDLVEDRIVDSVLSESFPEICGFGGRRKLTSGLIRATGFKFLKLHELEKCNPKENGMNYCAVFTGEVNIFGPARAKAAYGVQKMIKDSLNADDASEIDKNIARLSAEEDQFMIRDEDNFDDVEGNGSDAFGIVCFVLAGIIFAGIIYWKCKDRKEGDTAFSNSRGSRGWFNRRSKQDYDPSANSIMPYNDDEGVSYGQPINMAGYSDNYSHHSSAYYDDEEEVDSKNPREIF